MKTSCARNGCLPSVPTTRVFSGAVAQATTARPGMSGTLSSLQNSSSGLLHYITPFPRGAQVFFIPKLTEWRRLGPKTW
jgi:hypothetical protein